MACSGVTVAPVIPATSRPQPSAGYPPRHTQRLPHPSVSGPIAPGRLTLGREPRTLASCQLTLASYQLTLASCQMTPASCQLTLAHTVENRGLPSFQGPLVKAKLGAFRPLGFLRPGVKSQSSYSSCSWSSPDMRQGRPFAASVPPLSSSASSSSPSSSSASACSPSSSSPLRPPPLSSPSSSPSSSPASSPASSPFQRSPFFAPTSSKAFEAPLSDSTPSTSTPSRSSSSTICNSTSTTSTTTSTSTSAISTSTTTTTSTGSSSTSSSRGGDGSGSLPQSHFWEWRKNIVVHYTVAGPLHDKSKPAVLLLPGFGVGTFHWEHQLRESEGGLAAAHRVWAIDFLGQGQSWPSVNPTPSSPSSSSSSSTSPEAVEAATVSAAVELTAAREEGNPNSVSAPSSDALSHPQSTSQPQEDSPEAAAIAGAAQVAKALEEGKEPGEEVWGFGTEAHDWAQELVFSVDTWKLQVEQFISEVIGEPVFVVGNSLGGYVGTYVAAERPDLVRGVALLNATPFWAFSPHPKKQPLLARLWPWGGMLPAPRIVGSFVSVWWDTLRSPATIRFLLQLVYARKGAVDEALVERIVGPTAHPAAASAFASIVFAPKALNTFDENLKRVKELGLDVCLVYGREDPWVVPLWGYRLKRALPSALYYELSPCGHCPHHEAPQVVNALLRGWLAYASSTTPVAPPLITGQAEEQEKAEGPKTPSSILGELQSTEWHVLDAQGTFEPASGIKESETQRGVSEESIVDHSYSSANVQGKASGDEVVEVTRAEDTSGSRDAVDHVRVRLIHSPPISPISFVQAALETVMATVKGPK